MGQRKLGVIINPIAGMGGAVGLHGTDGDRHRRALARGAVPIAPQRAARGLRKLSAVPAPQLRIWAAAGEMGADAVRSLGREATAVGEVPASPTTRADTQAAARAMRDAEADLILFAGGDGTARDIAAAVGEGTPLLGIPTGVKMHSAVFGATPEAAGETAARFLLDPERTPLRAREVLDAAPGSGGVESFLTARVPYARGLLQSGKATVAAADERDLDLLCAEIAREMEAGRLYILGPGTTVGRIKNHLGAGTISGVDAVQNGRLVAGDASAARLLELLTPGREAAIVLGVIGGQGFLLGRGNQQISPEVIRRVGESNVLILAGEEKLRLLDPPVLRTDLGTEEPDPALLGYRRVRTAPGRRMIMKVV